MAWSAEFEHYESLITRADDVEVMMELADEEDDESMVGEIKTMFADLKEDLETMRLQTLLTGEYDACNCILSLHAGAGGTEAQDWTQMLYRMYTRFCERMGFTVYGAGLCWTATKRASSRVDLRSGPAITPTAI